MKPALHKSSIPASKVFVTRQLDDKHFDPTWHSHPEYQLFVVLEGKGTRFVGDSIKSFHPGELVLTGPHLPHLWRSDEAYFEKDTHLTTCGIVVYFNEHFLGDQVMATGEFLTIKKMLNRSMRGLEFYGPKKDRVIEMIRPLANMEGMKSVIRLLEVLDTLSLCKEYRYLSPLTYENPLKQSETDKMNTVYEYVFRNYRKNVKLDELASLLCMTATSFSRYFSAINNKAFSRFLSEIRIKHACEMLTGTAEPVASICYECGFNTLSNFNRQFKAVTSKTPLLYRKDFMNL